MATTFARSKSTGLSCIGRNAEPPADIHAKADQRYTEIKSVLFAIWNDLPKEFIDK